MSFFVNFPLFCIVGGLLCSVISSMLPARRAHSEPDADGDGLHGLPAVIILCKPNG